MPPAFIAKFCESYVGLRTEAAGVHGDFFLAWSRQDVKGSINNGEPWRETERKIFFSTHCRVRSDHTTKEAARLGSLGPAALAVLTGMCEEFSSHASLEDGHLSQWLGDAVHQRGVAVLFEASRKMATIAQAFPADFPRADTLRYQVAACRHCGWEYFIDVTLPNCTHCGGPAA